jgi:tRNA threonylcarbamoyladenosine biosynthesis protein TsaE
MGDDFTLDLADEAATMQFGEQLARAIEPNLTIFLEGNLGAGKTTMVRGLLRGLGFTGKVKSPTYTLLESYEIEVENGLILTINHFDLYRFNDEEEWEAAGFREAFNTQSVCLIEWPEKASHCLPNPDVEVKLDMQAKSVSQVMGRRVKVTGFSTRGKDVCKQLHSYFE